MNVIMYYLEGCKACELSKPVFDSLSEEYKEFSFEKAQLGKEKFDLYIEHAETQPAKEYLRDEHGEIVRNSSGKPFSNVLKDEDGNTVMEPVLAAPSFYFIGDGEFLGKSGNIEEVKQLLPKMKELLNEQD